MRRSWIPFFILLLCFLGYQKNGSEERKISLQLHEGTQLAFDLSPDGTMIVFDLLGQLWLLPAAGGDAKPLTDSVKDRAEDLGPVFSPEGKKIAFHSVRPEGEGLCLLSLEDRHLEWIRKESYSPPPYAPDHLAWSPDGRKIAMARSDSILTLDVETGEEKKVEVQGLPKKARQFKDPAWSRDGDRLAIVDQSGYWREGSNIWEIPVNGGTAVSLFAGEGFAPSYSPDGKSMAFFTRQAKTQIKLCVLDFQTKTVATLVDDLDIARLSLRWFPDSSSLLFSADGRLWRIDRAGQNLREIPFTARLEFRREVGEFRPVRFPRPGSSVPERGHMGLALSPDGKKIGLIALGKLWVFAPGGPPQPVASLPPSAAGLAWSPDGQQIAWSSGPGAAEDLFTMDTQTAQTRRLTELPGSETGPSWSPDGKSIAFFYYPEPREAKDAAKLKPGLRVIPANIPSVRKVEETIGVAEVSGGTWSPDSRGLVVVKEEETVFYPLSGPPRKLKRFPKPPAYLQWLKDGSIFYVDNDRLWKARFNEEEGLEGEAIALSDDAALYLSAASDGSLLYISDDGLRLRRPAGEVERLGWPISYEIPEPGRLLIQNVRIIDGQGTPLSEPKDILVEHGKISRIEPSGKIRADGQTQVVAGEGRTIMPGMVDLHFHVWNDCQLPGLLYHGVTTIRNAGEAPAARLAGLRDAIEAGIRPGPRVVLGAFMFWDSTFGIGLRPPEADQSPTDRDGIARAMSLLRGFGGYYAKLIYLRNWTLASDLIRGAHAAGMPASGHCVHQLPLIAAGIDGKEHATAGGSFRSDRLPYDDLLQLYRAAGIWVVPTITYHSMLLALIADPTILDRRDTAAFLHPMMRSGFSRAVIQLRQFYSEPPEELIRLHVLPSRQHVRKLHEAGIVVATGTDMIIPWAVHDELEQLTLSGLSPQEAIQAATSTAARILGAEAEIGTIEKGKWADLVILEANPLEDIRNTRKIWKVIKGGALVDREAILSFAAQQ